MDDRTGRVLNIWQHRPGMCSNNYFEKIFTEQALADNLNGQSKRVHMCIKHVINYYIYIIVK